MQGGQRRAFPDEGAELGHLGQHHGHDFHAVDLVLGELARFLGLDDEHAEGFAKTLHRDAEEGRKDLFPVSA